MKTLILTTLILFSGLTQAAEVANFILSYSADKCLNAPGALPICKAVPDGVGGAKMSVPLDDCTVLTTTQTLCRGLHTKQVMQDGYTFELRIYFTRIVEAGASNPLGVDIVLQIQDATGQILDARSVDIQYKNGTVTNQIGMGSSYIYAADGVSYSSGVVLEEP